MQGQQCSFCVHSTGVGSCPAFPDGIPGEIMAGAQLHTMVMEGQAEPVTFEVDPAQKDDWARWQALVDGVEQA